jgi:hypothetical protein
LATVGLVIVEGICDARQNARGKGLGEMDHFEGREESLV